MFVKGAILRCMALMQVQRIRSLVASRRIGYDTTQSRSRIVCSVGYAMPLNFEDRKSRIEDLPAHPKDRCSFDTDFIGISVRRRVLLRIIG